MVKLTVVLTVIVTSILVEKVTTAQYFDVQNFLKSLQQQLKEEQQQIRHRQSYNYKNNDDENYYGSLNKKDIDQNIRLTYKKSKGKRNSQKQVSRVSYQDLEQYVNNRRPFTQGQNKKSYNYDYPDYTTPDYPGERDEKPYRDDYTDYPGERDEKSHDPDYPDYPGERQGDSRSEYSKVYVVLNSEAIKRSKNKDKLNALLSSLLASPPSRERRDRHRHDRAQYAHHHDQRDNRHRNQQQDSRYKGFHLSNDYIRRKMDRDSNEVYARDVVEKDPPPPPRRPRESRGSGGGGRGGRDRGHERGSYGGGGGGGGGGNGRTAIPYIRHRGDIYERDS